jgi:outer membrane protein assembly factor BamE
MPETTPSHVRLLLLAVVVTGLAGCTSVGTTLAGFSIPYKIDIVQGNVITREQLALLQPGLPRVAVREILGTPLLTDVFHADRWDYAFTLRRQGAQTQNRKVTVFFKGDVVERTEADALPSEAEFVSTLRTTVKLGDKLPLEASEEKLRDFPAPKPVPAPPIVTTAPVEYPPLESSSNK